VLILLGSQGQKDHGNKEGQKRTDNGRRDFQLCAGSTDTRGKQLRTEWTQWFWGESLRPTAGHATPIKPALTLALSRSSTCFARVGP